MASCVVTASLLGPFWPGGSWQPKRWSTCSCGHQGHRALFPPAGRDVTSVRWVHAAETLWKSGMEELSLAPKGRPSTPGCLVCVEKWSQSLITLAYKPFSQWQELKIRILLAAAGMFWTTAFELTQAWKPAAPWVKDEEFHMSKNLKAGNLLWKEMKS